MVKQLILFFTILISVSGFSLFQCTPGTTAPEFKEEIIVNGYLIVGHGVDTIYVSKSLTMDLSYSHDTAALSTDSIFITVNGRSYRLLEYDEKPGAYYLPKDSMIITPGFEYQLSIHVNNKTIRASTMAPEQVHIKSLNTDTSFCPYPDPEKSTRFQLSWDETDFTAAYEISVISKQPHDLIDWGFEQFIEHRLERYDYDTLLAFPPVSDFPVGKNETSAEISWYAFCYYGDYTVKLYAIDDNLWDLASSSVVYMPQSSEFEQPVYRIEGGFGIFAAVSVDSVHIHVKRQE